MKSEYKVLLSFFAGIVVSLGLATPSFAEDGKDHPLVNRYPGTTISNYDYKEFEEAQLLLSKPYEKGDEWVADKVLPLEGQVTYIHYTKPDTVSALQIFRNYRKFFGPEEHPCRLLEPFLHLLFYSFT